MEVTKIKDGSIQIEMKNYLEPYYMSSFQAKWDNGNEGAGFHLDISEAKARELCDKLTSVLNEKNEKAAQEIGEAIDGLQKAAK